MVLVFGVGVVVGVVVVHTLYPPPPSHPPFTHSVTRSVHTLLPHPLFTPLPTLRSHHEPHPPLTPSFHTLLSHPPSTPSVHTLHSQDGQTKFKNSNGKKATLSAYVVAEPHLVESGANFLNRCIAW